LDISVHLDAAHENLAKRDLQRAAQELGSAADRLKSSAENAPNEARQEMRDAASGLARIESDVRSGSLTSIETLDHHLAKANASLARYHYLRAVDAWVARQDQTTGREMVEAINHLETGSKRIGHDMRGAEASFSNHARGIGGTLAGGGRVAATDVDRTMKGLGREINELVQEVRSKL
jgi:hypothetical protein